jgi:hypothetical protein
MKTEPVKQTIPWKVAQADLLMNALSYYYEWHDKAMAPEDRDLLAQVMDDLKAFFDGAQIVYTVE